MRSGRNDWKKRFLYSSYNIFSWDEGQTTRATPVGAQVPTHPREQKNNNIIISARELLTRIQNVKTNPLRLLKPTTDIASCILSAMLRYNLLSSLMIIDYLDLAATYSANVHQLSNLP